MHSTCRQRGRNIKTRCIWVDIKLAQKKGLKFYQTRSNAFILYNTLPAYCIPKAIKMETGEIIYEKRIWITSTASEDFLQKLIGWRNWIQKLVDKQKAPNQPNQTKSNSQNRATCCGRTNVPFECSGNRYTFFTWVREYQFVCWTFGERQRHRRRRRCRSSQNGATRWWTLILPARGDTHRLQGAWIATCSCETSRKLLVFVNSWTRSRVTLIEKIFKPICGQSNAYNPFSEKSKKMIRDMGNVELFEVCETIPKVHCSECLLY